MLNFTSDRFFEATMVWSLYYLSSFMGWETMETVTAITGLALSTVAMGALAVWPIVWAVKHVRVTIV